MRRLLFLVLSGVAIAIAGSVWIARSELVERRAEFETDGRIAHRLLSQRAVQHEAILATLALLQPGGAGEQAPEQRLPALYPQVQRVLRRDRGAEWPGRAVESAALHAAEESSRTAGRAALAGVDFAAGRYTLVMAASPASFALQIDLSALVPMAEWTLPADGETRALLAYVDPRLGLQQRVLAPGRVDGAGWHFGFSKHLSADSQPFDLQTTLRVGWSSLPWLSMLVWSVLTAAAMAAVGAWQSQREARRRAQELLRLGQVGRLNALGELAAGMAHELNQPLTALLANTQAAMRLLADDPPDIETSRGAMTQAVQQARRASEVVMRLRRVVERPELGANLRALHVGDALRSALDLLEPECRRLGVSPSVSCEPATLSVQAEPVALEQIIHNLLSNALHALSQVPAETRRLMLSAVADGASGVVAIRDSGSGISADALPRLFEPFFSARPGGLGLGLSLCETMATGMGGSLTAHNVAPRGAEFRLSLPLVA